MASGSPPAESIRRAAFDIGSGAIKLQIADLDVASGRVVRVVFARERPVKFALDWKAHGRLSDAIADLGLAVLRELCATCAAHGAESYAAIATEVFRKAPNGAAYLERVERELGLCVQVVTQKVEAHLGFLTACALSESPRASVIAWDSGGASFQISGAGGACFSGALGASVATALLVERVQRSTLRDTPSPNPVAVEQADALVRLLRAELPDVPAWLLGAAGIRAIGGPNSLFNVAAIVVRAENIGAAHAAEMPALTDGEGFVAGPRPVLLRRADARAAIHARCGESDEVLALLGYSEAALVVPKLCLLLAVMEHAQLERVEFLPAIGSCAGLLLSEEHFAAGRRLRGS